VRLIKRERQLKKAQKRMAKLEEKADNRKKVDKVDGDLKADSFTVDKISEQTS
jgi:hypothetical protein